MVLLSLTGFGIPISDCMGFNELSCRRFLQIGIASRAPFGGNGIVSSLTLNPEPVYTVIYCLEASKQRVAWFSIS
jgi:hypothetical protein